MALTNAHKHTRARRHAHTHTHTHMPASAQLIITQGCSYCLSLPHKGSFISRLCFSVCLPASVRHVSVRHKETDAETERRFVRVSVDTACVCVAEIYRVGKTTSFVPLLCLQRWDQYWLTEQNLKLFDIVHISNAYQTCFLLAHIKQQMRSHFNLCTCLHRLHAGSCLSCVSLV